jgi:DNA replication licensing factor MCM2
MHLRDVVRDDDVNLAIRVMLDSFISSQKYGVQRTLRKSFQRYLNYAKDNNDLLFYMLQALVRDELAFSRSMFKNLDQRIEIEQKYFEDKAKSVNIHQFSDFYASNSFKAKFSLDTTNKKIVCL